MQLAIRLRDWILATSTHQRPSQIAWAVACGILLGLLPKFTGLFVLAAAICFCLPVHLPLLAITAFICTFAAPYITAPVGRVGLWSLTESPVATFCLGIDALPLVPWLGINNTVVFGTCFIWLASSLPIYIVSLITTKILINNVNEAPHEVTVDTSTTANVSAYQELRPINGPLEPGPTSQPVSPPVAIISQEASTPVKIPQSEFQLDKPNYLDPFEDETFADSDIATTDAILRRASKLAEWADEAIASVLQDDTSHLAARFAPPAESTDIEANMLATEALASNSIEDQWLIETTLEVVRIAEQAVTQQASLKLKTVRDSEQNLHPEGDESAVLSDMAEKQEIKSILDSTSSVKSLGDGENRQFGFGSDGVTDVQAELRLTPSDTIRLQQSAHADWGSHVATHLLPANQPREEALHYLLRHLKGIQDKVQNQ